MDKPSELYWVSLSTYVGCTNHKHFMIYFCVIRTYEVLTARLIFLHVSKISCQYFLLFFLLISLTCTPIFVEVRIFSTQKRHFLKCACLLACHTDEVVVLYLARQLNRYTAGGQFHTAGQFCTEHLQDEGCTRHRPFYLHARCFCIKGRPMVVTNICNEDVHKRLNTLLS